MSHSTMIERPPPEAVDSVLGMTLEGSVLI